MERESNLHSARLDDELAREVESLVRGAPVEARIEDDRLKEDAGDGEVVPQSLVGEVHDVEGGDEPLGGLSRGEIIARSELAVHLRPRIFPASRAEVLACAEEEHASPDLLGQLHALPDREFHTVQEVWEALGGKREEGNGHVLREVAAPEPTPEAPAAARPSVRFGFRFDPWYRVAALPFGVSPSSASVEIHDDPTEGPVLLARFGPWSVKTPVANVVGVTPTGPYSALKTVGPAHVSLVDRGLTFASNRRQGLCIRFRRAVPGLAPTALVRHPALTVTVDDVDGLARALRSG